MSDKNAQANQKIVGAPKPNPQEVKRALEKDAKGNVQEKKAESTFKPASAK